MLKAAVCLQAERNCGGTFGTFCVLNLLEIMPSPSEFNREMDNECDFKPVGDRTGNEFVQSPAVSYSGRGSALHDGNPGIKSDSSEDDAEDEAGNRECVSEQGQVPGSSSDGINEREEEYTHRGQYVPNVPAPAQLHHQLVGGPPTPHRALVYATAQPGILMPTSVVDHCYGANPHVVGSAAYQQLPPATHQRAPLTEDSSTKEKLKPKRKRVISCEQRKAANIRERRRMTSLNHAFDTLRKAVPTFHYEKKLSRIETLKLAIQYIYFMTEVLNGRDPKHVSMTPRVPVLQGPMAPLMGPGRRGRRRREQNHLLMHPSYPFL